MANQTLNAQYQQNTNTGTNTYHFETNANQVKETVDRKFITPTEKNQINNNRENIALLANDLQEAATLIQGTLAEQQTAIDTLNNEVGIGNSSEGKSLNDRVAELEAFKDSKDQALGIAGLDENGKVVTEQLPDTIFGQLEYKGTFNASTGKFESWSDKGDQMGTSAMRDYSLATKSQTQNENYDPLKGKFDNTNKKYYPAIGNFWIIATSGTFDGTKYDTGDWIIFNGQGNGYAKVDNSDAVMSVAGLLGNITDVALKKALGLDKVDNIPDSLKAVLSATKLATARTINVSGDATGTAQSFDGTKNIVIPITLGDGKVTSIKIAVNAVTTDKIQDGAVTTDKIEDAAVTKEKIANGAVDGSKLASGAVTGDKLANSGVTAGSYSIVNVDAKGRVLSGGQLITVYSGDQMPSNVPIGGFAIKVQE